VLYSEAQRRIAEAVPTISLWHKSNVVSRSRTSGPAC
jgi:hypothetical protein